MFERTFSVSTLVFINNNKMSQHFTLIFIRKIQKEANIVLTNLCIRFLKQETKRKQDDISLIILEKENK